MDGKITNSKVSLKEKSINHFIHNKINRKMQSHSSKKKYSIYYCGIFKKKFFQHKHIKKPNKIITFFLI